MGREFGDEALEVCEERTPLPCHLQPTAFFEKVRVWVGFHTAQGGLTKTLYGGVVAFGLHLGECHD